MRVINSIICWSGRVGNLELDANYVNVQRYDRRTYGSQTRMLEAYLTFFIRYLLYIVSVLVFSTFMSN